MMDLVVLMFLWLFYDKVVTEKSEPSSVCPLWGIALCNVGVVIFWLPGSPFSDFVVCAFLAVPFGSKKTRCRFPSLLCNVDPALLAPHSADFLVFFIFVFSTLDYPSRMFKSALCIFLSSPRRSVLILLSFVVDLRGNRQGLGVICYPCFHPCLFRELRWYGVLVYDGFGGLMFPPRPDGISPLLSSGIGNWYCLAEGYHTTSLLRNWLLWLFGGGDMTTLYNFWCWILW